MSSTIQCPYVVGAQYQVYFAPGTVLSKPFKVSSRLQLTVLQPFQPFTISPVLKVRLDSDAATPSESSHLPLPSTMVLKLFDRRFADDLRDWHNAPPATHESENLYRSYISNQGSTRSYQEWEAKFLADEEQEIESPIEEREAHLEALISSYYENEVQAYERLASLQGKAIPVFFGQVRFVVDESSPESIDASVPGVLMEYIEGNKLSDLSPSAFSDAIGSACVDIVNTCRDADILNLDVRLENFIIPSSDTGGHERLVVMIDFAQCRFREGIDDMDWKKEKGSTDEEGAVGYPLQKKFGWEYQPSWRYMIMEDDA